MNYMPILPVGMFDVYGKADVADVFILPQYWGIDDYKKFYTSRAWNTVIIDNAMYEQPDHVDFGNLIDIAGELRSERTFVVTPEDFNDNLRTVEYVTECFDNHKLHGYRWEAMCVLHGTPAEMKGMYNILRDMYDIAYGVAVASWRLGYDRGAIYNYIGFGKKTYVHAMGLDSILETSNLHRAGYNSVDSSLAATTAVNSIPLNIDTLVVRKGVPDDPKRVDLMQKEFGEGVTAQTLKNVRTMRRMCSYGIY